MTTQFRRPFFAVRRMWRFIENTANFPRRLSAIENAVTRLEKAVTRLETKFGPEAQASHNISAALQAAGWMIRHQRENSLYRSNAKTAGGSRNVATSIEPIEQAFARLKELEPRIYPVWLRLFENGLAEYRESTEEESASLSVWEHQYARVFGAYVGVFSSGRLLDIGSGAKRIPSYLAGYPTDLLSLLDPLEAEIAFPCEFARGFNEFLPWPDASFDTVISGTSLDHVLSLEKSLEEVVRVLRPGGHYVVWLASVPGSPPYEPNAPEFEPPDRFHLFHFDRAWIEPLFARYFDFVDITVIAYAGFDHVFYCMRPKPNGTVPPPPADRIER